MWITSWDEDDKVRDTCEELGVRMFPKFSVAHSSSSWLRRRLHVAVIGEDDLVSDELPQTEPAHVHRRLHARKTVEIATLILRRDADAMVAYGKLSCIACTHHADVDGLARA